jgi:hypothetical protein
MTDAIIGDLRPGKGGEVESTISARIVAVRFFAHYCIHGCAVVPTSGKGLWS